MASRNLKELFLEDNESRFVEVYGSLLNPDKRKELLNAGGKMTELGPMNREGWKLSFDKLNIEGVPVLNLVKTDNNNDIYYTKIFKTDNLAFRLVAERELGVRTLKDWLEGKVELKSYRPTIMSSKKFGETISYIIPNEFRKKHVTSVKSDYVNIVKKGIISSFNGKKKWTNLIALVRAIEKSSESDETFSNFVEEAEEKYSISDCIYDSSIEEISKKEIVQIKEIDLTRIFNPFMLKWGEMTRQLGYIGMSELFNKIISKNNLLEPFRRKNLFLTDIGSIEKQIVELFDEISNTQFTSKKRKIKRIRYTATSKILHLICPDFFMMWDIRIRQMYMKGHGNGKDYFTFLLDMKKIFEEHEKTINSLEKKFGKKQTKIIDQYNYMKAIWLNE